MEKSTITICPNCRTELSIPEGEHSGMICPICGNDLKTEDAEDDNQKDFFSKPFVRYFIWGLGFLLTVPVFLILHYYFPDPDWTLNADRWIIFVSILLIIFLILRYLTRTVLVISALVLIFLTYGSLQKKYGFKQIFEDYNEFLTLLKDNPNPIKLLINQLQPYENKEIIINAIDYEVPIVRNYAVSTASKHFKEFSQHSDYRKLIQIFSVFKEINSNWYYVNDPESRNYFAKASESIKHLSGDCDDHSILMTASIIAIGGEARIIHTNGHMYPEVYIGNKKDLESINYLIKVKLFRDESKGMSLHYHVDDSNKIWLNLDYTAKYPGGPYLEEEVLNIIDFSK